jgi:hypothetical protein
MTQFPAIPLDVRSEIELNGTWTDVSAYNDYGPVSIGRGHPDESTTTSASTLALVLTNADGRFSPNNPTSPYYPSIAQNVPCRISIPAQANYLRLEAGSDDRAYVNDAGGGSPLGISGSIEMRIALTLTDWQGCVLAGKWDGGGCWLWTLNDDGTMTFQWFDSGIVAHSVTSTVPVPFTWSPMALRVTMDATTGNVTFSTGTTIGGTYAALGAVQSGTGGAATSIAVNHGSPLVVGWSVDVDAEMYGSVAEYKLYNGIGGTVAADGIFSAQPAGTTTWADSAGNAWLLGGGAEISSRSYRGHFEIADFPKSQDPSGKTVTVAIGAGGLLRRKGQGSNPVRSAMFRAWTLTGASLAAYHPMEDGTASQSLASGIGGPAARFSGAPQLASNSDFACSASLPVLNGAAVTGRVPAWSGTWNGNQVSWLMEVPAAGEANGAEIMRVATTGTVTQVVVTYGTGGSLTITGYSASGAQLFTSGPFAFAVNGETLLCWLSLANDGSGGVNWELATVVPDAANALAVTGNIGSASTGAVASWTMDGGGQLLQTVAGHVAVQATTGDLTPLGGPLNAWLAEPAGQRLARLCGEEGIPFRGLGNLPATMAMGAQSQQTLTALLQECADADRGVWFEPRQCLGWGYVARSALYNQAAQVALDYGQDHLAPWSSAPTRDDQVIKNDVTLTQSGDGTTARAYAAPGQPVSGGRLSVLPPSQGGCGTYDGGSATVNLYSDGDLAQLAWWIVHTGTVDEDRHPGISIDLANTDLASQYWAILNMDLGSRLTIANPPVWLQPDQVSQLAQQITEDLFADTLVVSVAGVPESPYEVAQDGAGFHVESGASTLHAGISSGATSMSVDTAAGYPLWSTSGADYPVDLNVAGERMTVTAVSGGSSPQSFTVSRSANGVVKAQAAGAPIALWNSPAAAL